VRPSARLLARLPAWELAAPVSRRRERTRIATSKPIIPAEPPSHCLAIKGSATLVVFWEAGPRHDHLLEAAVGGWLEERSGRRPPNMFSRISRIRATSEALVVSTSTAIATRPAKATKSAVAVKRNRGSRSTPKPIPCIALSVG
jgi:hypothetical protein